MWGNEGNEDLPAEQVKPHRLIRWLKRFAGKLTRKPAKMLADFLYAWQLVHHEKPNVLCPIIIDGSSGFIWFFAGYINRLFVKHRRPMLLVDCFLD